MSPAEPAFWLLLGATLAIFGTVPGRMRPLVLLVASLTIFGLPDPWRLVWLAAVVVVAVGGDFGGRIPALVPAVGLIVALALTKFGAALGCPVPAAPPGFSFLIFTVVAHLIDCARDGSRRVTLPALVLHFAWFPKLLAGPIERSSVLVPQFAALALRPGLAALGYTLILSGLVKKLVIADSLAPVVDAAYAIPAYAAPLDLLIASYFFAFQIYCDFSGYSDLALGLSALFGLRLTQNFNRPYLSPTVSEFWSARWHITLGHWFRDYVYIPLGGSRHGRLRQIANLLVVFSLSGLWHAGLGYGIGWGFVVWGLLNGAFVAAESMLPAARPGIWRPIGVLVTFHLVLITWVFFRAATLTDALVVLRRIGEGLAAMPALLPAYPFSAAQMLGACLIVVLFVVEIAGRGRPWPEQLAAAPMLMRWAAWYAALVALLLLGRWQGAGFIYARF